MQPAWQWIQRTGQSRGGCTETGQMWWGAGSGIKPQAGLSIWALLPRRGWSVGSLGISAKRPCLPTPPYFSLTAPESYNTHERKLLHGVQHRAKCHGGKDPESKA